jgi:hypothetical protein
MATVNKDFKIKSGLIVEGTTATVNGYDILTKNPADDQHIIDLIGGEATSANTPNTVVKRNGDGDFAAGVITADLVGDVTGTVSSLSNHDTADLAENATNKYFTNQRAIDANTGLWDTIGAAATAQSNAEDYADGLAVNYDPAGSAATAQSNAEDYADGLASNYDPAGSAATAQSNAEDYADGLASNYDPAGSASTVQGNLDTHTNATSAHGVTGSIVGTTDTQTLSNKTLGSDLAAGGYKVSGLADPTADQEAATKAYVDDAVSALVNGAPELLDTLNELAAAINDDEGFAGTISSAIGEKVAKAGDSMSGNLDFGGTNKVTSLATPTSSTDAATKGYVDTEISDLDSAAQGYANDAETNAIAHADALTTTDIAEGTSLYFTNQRALDATNAAYDATGTAQGIVDALDTDEIEEGTTNLYFTNQRAIDAVDDSIDDKINALDTDDIEEGSTNLYHTDARAKTSAADLLTGANLTNITITGTGAGLTITAENGVADSDTDDLTEGSTNLYFTDARALTAIEDANIQPSSIDITWVRREEATWTDVNTASKATCHSAGSDTGSMKYLVRVTAQVGGVRHSHVTEVLATVAGDNGVAVVEYGTIYTSENPLATVTVEWNAGTSAYDLNVTTANNNSEVMVAATLITALD